MTADKMEFQGKDVTDAIRNACDSLNVSQEDLDIEVLETGSVGVFGLCKQKARLRVSIKEKRETSPPVSLTTELGFEKIGKGKDRQVSDSLWKNIKNKSEKFKEKMDAALYEDEDEDEDDNGVVDEDATEEKGEEPARPTGPSVTPETMEVVRTDLLRVLELMGCPSEVTVNPKKNGVAADIAGAHVDMLIGSDGRVLDGLEYLLRKMVSKKLAGKVTIMLDSGNYRANRIEELKTLGLTLAQEVKDTGKTRAIPSLNPSERRAVHMILQEDNEVKSRSVGEGLFKKILIYHASGSGRPKKKSSGRGRRKQGN